MGLKGGEKNHASFSCLFIERNRNDIFKTTKHNSSKLFYILFNFCLIMYKNILVSDSSTPDSPNTAIEGQTKETFEPSTDQKPKGVTVSNIPKLVDNKRRHMEKTLSQAQRDQLLMNTAKEDPLMKREMVKSFEQSNKSLEDSISKMTTCLTSLGDGIAKGMQMMAMALSAQPHNSTAHPAPRARQVYLILIHTMGFQHHLHMKTFTL